MWINKQSTRRRFCQFQFISYRYCFVNERSENNLVHQCCHPPNNKLVSKATHTRAKYFQITRNWFFSLGVHARILFFVYVLLCGWKAFSILAPHQTQFKKSSLEKSRDSWIYAAQKSQPQNIYYWLPAFFCNWKNSGNLKRQRQLNNWEALWINRTCLFFCFLQCHARIPFGVWTRKSIPDTCSGAETRRKWNSAATLKCSSSSAIPKKFAGWHRKISITVFSISPRQIPSSSFRLAYAPSLWLCCCHG